MKRELFFRKISFTKSIVVTVIIIALVNYYLELENKNFIDFYSCVDFQIKKIVFAIAGLTDFMDLPVLLVGIFVLSSIFMLIYINYITTIEDE